MSRRAPSIALTDDERATLEAVAAGRQTEVRDAQRARIILAAAAGETNEGIAAQEGLSRLSVGVWRQRFAREGLAGLKDLPRPGKPPVYSEADRLRVIETACGQQPEAETHWSV